MVVDLDALKKRAERLEQLAKNKQEEMELKKRIRTAKATLRQDTIVAQVFGALKRRIDKEIGDIK